MELDGVKVNYKNTISDNGRLGNVMDYVYILKKTCISLQKYIRFYGEVSNDLKHGDGREIFENGDQFKGEYRNGKPNGYGEY